MYKLDTIHKPFREAGALHTHLNLFGFWDEGTFITKSGDPGLVLRLTGIDYESLDFAARDLAVKRLEAALRVFDEKIRIYQLLFKRQAPAIPTSSHPNPLVQSAAEQRAAYLDRRAKDLYALEIFLVLIRESGGAQKKVSGAVRRAGRDFFGAARDLVRSFASDRTRVLFSEQIEAEARQLQHRTESFAQQLEDLAQIEILDAHEAFRVLHSLVNLDQGRRDNAHLIRSHSLDIQLADTEIEAHRDHLRVGDRFVKVLTLKEPPSETWPLILRDLMEIKASFCVVSEWQPIDNGKARKLIQARRRHFHNSKTSFMSNLSTNENKAPGDELIDDSKEAAIADLGECLTAIGHEGKYFGEFSLTCLVYGNDLRELDRNVPEFIRAFTKYDGIVLEERYNLLNAFFAAIKNCRAPFEMTEVLCLFSSAPGISIPKSRSAAGCARCPHPCYRTQVIRRLRRKEMRISQTYQPALVATHAINSASQEPKSALRGLMQRLGLTLLVCTLVICATGSASASEARDKAAVRGLGDTFAKAFVQKNAELRASLFAENGTFVTPVGDFLQGRVTMVKDFGSEAQAVNANTQAAFSNYRVRFIKPDLAVVDALLTLHNVNGPDGTVIPVIPVNFFYVASRHGSQWLIEDGRAHFAPAPANSMTSRN